MAGENKRKNRQMNREKEIREGRNMYEYIVYVSE